MVLAVLAGGAFVGAGDSGLGGGLDVQASAASTITRREATEPTVRLFIADLPGCTLRREAKEHKRESVPSAGSETTQMGPPATPPWQGSRAGFSDLRRRPHVARELRIYVRMQGRRFALLRGRSRDGASRRLTISIEESTGGNGGRVSRARSGTSPADFAVESSPIRSSQS